MQFTSAEAAQRFDDLHADPSRWVVGLDFDGTLAPIVDDPQLAHIHPGAAAALMALAPRVVAIAVITGRPARQVLALGGLDEVGTDIGQLGRELFVYGQYGDERWTSRERRIISPPPPKGLATLLRTLPQLLRSHDAADAWVEEKGLAVAVHTRRCARPEQTFERLLPVLTTAAHERGLAVEPGRLVIEIRAQGMHKGIAVRDVVSRTRATGMMFVGDDLGDLEAFRALRELSDDGLSTLAVCSASTEQNELAQHADLLVDGPDGVVTLLRSLGSA